MHTVLPFEVAVYVHLLGGVLQDLVVRLAANTAENASAAHAMVVVHQRAVICQRCTSARINHWSCRGAHIADENNEKLHAEYDCNPYFHMNLRSVSTGDP
jgi:hypothetical protein